MQEASVEGYHLASPPIGEVGFWNGYPNLRSIRILKDDGGLSTSIGQVRDSGDMREDAHAISRCHLLVLIVVEVNGPLRSRLSNLDLDPEFGAY